MTRITPLAKLLAEANGIRWETLKGTGDPRVVGDAETITEQDLLNHLRNLQKTHTAPGSSTPE